MRELHYLARAAGALVGFRVTEFVVASAQRVTAETIKDFKRLALHDAGQDL